MPIYEYKCEACGKVFTKLQKFSDAPLTVHEECGSGPVERLISAPAFHFKGTGWYVTDYAKSSTGESKGESKSDTKSDAKPAESKPPETKSSTESSGKPAKSETKPA